MNRKKKLLKKCSNRIQTGNPNSLTLSGGDSGHELTVEVLHNDERALPHPSRKSNPQAEPTHLLRKLFVCDQMSGPPVQNTLLCGHTHTHKPARKHTPSHVPKCQNVKPKSPSLPPSLCLSLPSSHCLFLPLSLYLSLLLSHRLSLPPRYYIRTIRRREGSDR